MKRFLVFIIICIVTLSLGLTTYYFLRDTETILVLDSYFEVNVMDTFTIDVEHINPNPNTDINFESLHSNIVQWNPVNEKFEAVAGGRAVLRVTSNKSDFKPVTIEVVVGDGTANAPFFIKSIEDLLFLGKEEVYNQAGDSTLNPKTLDKYYKLQADLDFATLTSLDPVLMQNNNIPACVYEDGVWLPIGYNAQLGEGFRGVFNFNNHTIYNLNIVDADLDAGITLDHAGLFYVLEEGGVITNLTLNNVNIEGSYSSVGAIVGLNHGTVERSMVETGTVDNSNNAGVVGGAVGRNEMDVDLQPIVEMVYSNVTVNTSSIGGGVVGYNYGGIVVSSYSDGSVVGNFDTTLGGIVGLNEYKSINLANYDAIIKDCYYYGVITSQSTQLGAIIGQNINEDDTLGINIIRGNYYSSEISGSINAIGGIDNATIDTEKIGVYNKTVAQLHEQQTYFSYVDRQDASIYWSFTKTWVLNSEVNNGLPILNMESPKIDHGFRNIADGVSIYSITDLLNIENDMQGSYILRNNLDLSQTTLNWIPLGYNGVDDVTEFNGTFMADIDPETGKPYIISNLFITSSRSVNGLFATIGSQGIIDGLIIKNVKIIAGTSVGVVAGINNGMIKNITVENDSVYTDYFITAVNNSGEANVGAIVGINQINASIENVYSNLIINVNASQNNHANGGGLVGRNQGTILLSSSESEILGIGAYSKNIGGIAGLNNKNIESVYYLGDITASTTSNEVFVGGLVGYLSNSATIKYSYVAYGNYEGTMVGALVGESNGYVSESYADIVNITAKYAGGLAFNIADGSFTNCYTLAFMAGVNSDSVKSGFAYYIEYRSDSDMGEVINCFSAATFDAVGTNYAETYAPVRTEGFLVPRQAGKITNSIYDKQGQVLKDQNFVSLFNTEFVIPENERRIQVSTDHAYGTDGNSYSTFYAANFSSSTWSFVDGAGHYPTLIYALQMEEEV